MIFDILFALYIFLLHITKRSSYRDISHFTSFSPLYRSLPSATLPTRLQLLKANVLGLTSTGIFEELVRVDSLSKPDINQRIRVPQLHLHSWRL